MLWVGYPCQLFHVATLYNTAATNEPNRLMRLSELLKYLFMPVAAV